MESLGLETAGVNEWQDEMDEPATPRGFKPLINDIIHGKSKVVLCMEERGLPLLRRGWRTPDPSPTRTEAGPLPKCTAYNAKEVASRSPSPERRSVLHAEPAWARIRTPSPEPLSAAPLFPTTLLPMVAKQIQEAQYEAVQTVAPVPVKANHGPRWADIEAYGEGDSFPPPLPFETLPSLGSAGHPSDCGPACKYASKEKGCKDGSNCTHCHLCVWKRPHHSRKKKTGSGMSGQQDTSPETARDLMA